MLDPALLPEFLAVRWHMVILSILERRFGPVPCELATQVRLTIEEQRLLKLTIEAACCPDLEAFAALFPNLDQTFMIATPQSE
jgi:hypothetical protein